MTQNAKIKHMERIVRRSVNTVLTTQHVTTWMEDVYMGVKQDTNNNSVNYTVTEDGTESGAVKGVAIALTLTSVLTSTEYAQLDVVLAIKVICVKLPVLRNILDLNVHINATIHVMVVTM